MDISAQMKSQMIQNYVTQIDFNGDYSISKIKSELKSILHETPGVEIKYLKNKLITEDKKGNKVEKVEEKVKSIIIAFIDGENANGNPQVHKVEFYI